MGITVVPVSLFEAQCDSADISQVLKGTVRIRHTWVAYIWVVWGREVFAVALYQQNGISTHRNMNLQLLFCPNSVCTLRVVRESWGAEHPALFERGSPAQAGLRQGSSCDPNAQPCSSLLSALRVHVHTCTCVWVYLYLWIVLWGKGREAESEHLLKRPASGHFAGTVLTQLQPVSYNRTTF